jgi:hypothetical protein
MVEKDIHNALIAWLNKAEIPFEYSRTDKRTTGKLGQPDFAIYDKGRVLFVEVKMLGGKLRPEQDKRIKQLRDAGCQVVVAFSLEECVHPVTIWLAENHAMPLMVHPSRPLDCQGIPMGRETMGGKSNTL